MQVPKNEKLLWDDPKFSKLSPSAQRLTSVYAECLVEQAQVKHHPKSMPLVILDNACGTGVVTEALQPALQGRPAESFEITCGDFADAMVESVSERIRSSAWKNTRAMKVDAQDTKLPSEHFTHIFTNFGPMLFPNASAMLSECHRMLKPQGVCAFTTWKTVGWINDVREAFNSVPGLPAFPEPQKIAESFSKGRWAEEDYIEEQLVKHGFNNVHIEAIPNRSVFENSEQLRAVLVPCLAIVYKFWTDEERDQYANQETQNKIEKWFEMRYEEEPVAWDWIALVTTSTKPTTK